MRFVASRVCLLDLLSMSCLSGSWFALSRCALLLLSVFLPPPFPFPPVGANWNGRKLAIKNEVTKRPEYENVFAEATRNWRFTTPIGALDLAREVVDVDAERDLVVDAARVGVANRWGMQKDVNVLEIEAMVLAEWRRMCVKGGIFGVVVEALRWCLSIFVASIKYIYRPAVRDDAAQCAIRATLKQRWKM